MNNLWLLLNSNATDKEVRAKSAFFRKAIAKFDEKYILKPINESRIGQVVEDGGSRNYAVSIYPRGEGSVTDISSRESKKVSVQSLSSDWNCLEIDGVNYYIHFHPV
jgi:hypothetical protein